MEPSVLDTASRDRKLDQPPPRPPANRSSLMNMAAGPTVDAGIGQSSPVIQTMSAMGEARNALLKLSAALPPMAPGVMQFLQALESVVPQMVADMAAGLPPGAGGASMGGGSAPGADQAPTAPPVQAGTP